MSRKLISIKTKLKRQYELATQTLGSTLKLSISSKKATINLKKTSHVCYIIDEDLPNCNIQTLVHNTKKIDVICTNNFVLNDSYTTIQPNICIIAYSTYCSIISGEDWDTQKRKIISKLYMATYWKTILVLPISDKNSWLILLRKYKNEFIEVVYFNDTKITGHFNFVKWCFNNNLGAPGGSSGLAHALCIAGRSNYSEIHILGEENDWIKRIKVDDENKVLVNLNKKNNIYSFVTRKLHSLLYEYESNMRSLTLINRLLVNKGCIVYNHTPESFIDSFKKKRLPD